MPWGCWWVIGAAGMHAARAASATGLLWAFWQYLGAIGVRAARALGGCGRALVCFLEAAHTRATRGAGRQG